jgi:CelD/BcsL family acetyltransferase involved in cellulose biosynthesis
VTVRAGQQLIAVAPLLVSGGRLAWFSRLEILGTGHAGSDYLDVIVRRGHEAESLRAIAGVIAADARTLRLDHVRPAAHASRLAERLEAGGWHAAVTPGGVCPVIRLAGHTWDSYLATIGSSHRANIRRRLRALDQRFHVRFEQATTDDARREALAALVGYHERRWKDRGGSTAFFTPALRAFHDDATRRALDRGWLRMYVLRLDGQPVAVMYGFFYNSRFYFYQHGFDDRYRQHSVGLVLMALSVRAAIDSGAREFDMLWGDEAYKDLWAHEVRQLHRIHVYPNHAGGRLHRRAVDARRRMGRLVRRLRAGGTRAT